jgi:hypothetical protein
MHLVTVLALAATAQTMQFRNDVPQQTIMIMIRCRGHNDWVSDKPLVIKPGATASIKMHTGNFQVIAYNNKRQEDRSNRVMKSGQIARMAIAKLVSGDKKPKPFEIIDDYRDADED